MKYSIGISNFLEEISRLSHSIVSLYFFALVTEDGFLISPCYSLELCIEMDISFLFPFAFHFSSFLTYCETSSSPLLFTSLLFSPICETSSENHFGFLHFFFLGMVLITASCTLSPTSTHSSSGILSIRSNPLNLLVPSNVRDLI